MNPTFDTIKMLLFFSALATAGCWVVMPFAGFPGTFLLGQSRKPPLLSYAFAALIASACQSYLYLAYTAYLVHWTRDAINFYYLDPALIWSAAFVAIAFPLLVTTARTKREGWEDGRPTPLFTALCLTALATLGGFATFVTHPATMQTYWSWVL